MKQMLLETERNINDHYSAIVANDDNPWMITGATVTGNSHHATGEHCQDAHHTEVWDNGWGVAAVSDGAGTASKSHLASALLVKKATEFAQRLVEKMGWAERNELPSRQEWAHQAIDLMQTMQDSIMRFARLYDIPPTMLHATLIVVIFSPRGLMLTHIGDGRAGCRDWQGNYHSLMTPWQGEQAGQTVFITTKPKVFRNIVGISMFDRPAEAFFLLTDGCESLTWETLFHDPETEVLEKKNQPYKPFWDHTLQTISKMHKTLNPEQTGQALHSYLHNGHKAFETEPDDKTMIIGISSLTHQSPADEH